MTNHSILSRCFGRKQVDLCTELRTNWEGKIHFEITKVFYDKLTHFFLKGPTLAKILNPPQQPPPAGIRPIRALVTYTVADDFWIKSDTLILQQRPHELFVRWLYMARHSSVWCHNSSDKQLREQISAAVAANIGKSCYGCLHERGMSGLNGHMEIVEYFSVSAYCRW